MFKTIYDFDKFIYELTTFIQSNNLQMFSWPIMLSRLLCCTFIEIASLPRENPAQ